MSDKQDEQNTTPKEAFESTIKEFIEFIHVVEERLIDLSERVADLELQSTKHLLDHLAALYQEEGYGDESVDDFVPSDDDEFKD